MADETNNPNPDEMPEEWKRPGGPADYDEHGGAGLAPRPGDDVIGGGVSGGDEDPIGEPGFPDEAGTDPEEKD